MFDGSKDAVGERFGADVEFGLRCSVGSGCAYLSTNWKPAVIVGLTGLSEGCLRRVSAWMRFDRGGDCDR